ncbi:hypothetical protein [Sphingobium baderi]|uniref:hypothetical protein n=1 Tax=Sphingobium baderi TaxID=1332080 RepID=UPI0011DF5DA8|nr:hypothetical protein [Sphingobium baderi]
MARGNTTAREEQIAKDGVVLEYFGEIGGEDRQFSISSPALLRADNGLTIVPSFERVFRDLGLQFTNTRTDFKTVSDHLPRVKAYLGNGTLLQSRLKEKENALRKRAKEKPRRFLLYRLYNRIWTDEFLRQMRRVDEFHQRAAAEKLPLLKAAIKSLSRTSK